MIRVFGFTSLLAVFTAVQPRGARSVGPSSFHGVGDTLTVGSAPLARLRLPARTDTSETFVIRDSTRQLVSTEIQTIVPSGDRYTMVSTNIGARGTSVDTVVVSAKTFAAIRHVEVQPGRRLEVTYHDGAFEGTLTDSTGTHAVSVPATPDRLDFAIIAMVWPALPGVEGKTYTLHSIDIALPRDRERDVDIRIVGRERISWHGRDVDVWKTVTDFKTHQVTGWLTDDGRRLRWEIAMPKLHMMGEAK